MFFAVFYDGDSLTLKVEPIAYTDHSSKMEYFDADLPRNMKIHCSITLLNIKEFVEEARE